MSLEAWIQGQRSKGNESAARLGEALYREFGDVSLSVSSEKVSNSLDAEWKKQVKSYIKLGFHKELNLSEEGYRSSLPKFTPQPETYKGRFNIPVLVETRIPVKRQAELAGVSYYLDGFKIRDWENDPKGHRTPNVPYTTWMQDGRKYLGKSVSKVREMMEKDERGATEFDGIALYVKNSGVLKHHSIDLPGTSVGSDLAAYLCLWPDGPRLAAWPVGNADSRFGSASCGR